MRRWMLLGVVTAGNAFAVDEYLAVPKGSLEAAASLSHTRLTGLYDSDGERLDFEEDFGLDIHPTQTFIGAQFKYGFAPGLDFEASLQAGFTNEDAGDLSGTLPPVLAIKYAPRSLGAGVYAAVSLPMATGDFEDDGTMGLSAGALLRRQNGQGRFTGVATYATDTDFDGGIVGVMARPELLVNPRVGFFAQVGAIFSTEGDGHQINVGPGLHLEAPAGTFLNAKAIFTVAGENAPAGWELHLEAHHPLF